MQDLDLLLAACESAQVGMLVLDAELRPVVCNAFLRALHGHHDVPFVRGQFPGATDFRDADGEPLSTFAGVLEKVMALGSVRDLRLGVVHERTGVVQPVLVHADRLDDARGLAGVVVTMHALPGDQVAVQARLQRLAEHDELTGLLNRRGLLQHGDQLVQVLRDAGRAAGVYVVDVDGLKAANDTHGHAVGDLLLQHVAVASRQVAQLHGGLAARLGGDEFVVLTSVDAPVEHDLLHHLERRSREQPLPVDARISIGRSRSDRDGDTLARLLARADEAMYERRRLARGLSPAGENR